MRALALLLVLFVASVSHAQDDEPGGVKDPCEPNWGCWELFYSNPQTLLGLKASLSRGKTDDAEAARHASLLVAYDTQHHGFRDWLSAELALAGALGGGSAGNEGSLAGVVALGFRAPITPDSGPFLRIGSHGVMLGHEKLRVRVLEPMQARAGYQYMDGEVLLELGLTSGLALRPRFDLGGPARWRRGDALAVGAFVRLRQHWYRFEAIITHVVPSTREPALDVARVTLCGFQWSLAACAEGGAARGALESGPNSEQHASAFYGGLTVGLTP